jgi:hypothetical protein
MSIDLNAIPPIEGENARSLRDILRKSHGSFRCDWLLKTFGFSEQKAQQIAETLALHGYLERDDALENKDGRRIPWYKVTRQGKELMRASAARRIYRNTAQAALEEFMDRVRLINSDPRYFCSVSKVVVFGSFLRRDCRLGDVDVAADFEYRIPLKGNWWEIFQKHARNSGRHFRSLEDEIDWPRREVILALKARKRSLSILCLANWYGESILPVIALRKWTESYFWDGTGGSETIGAAKHAAMEKLRMIAWKFCRG